MSNVQEYNYPPIALTPLFLQEPIMSPVTASNTLTTSENPTPTACDCMACMNFSGNQYCLVYGTKKDTPVFTDAQLGKYARWSPFHPLYEKVDRETVTMDQPCNCMACAMGERCLVFAYETNCMPVFSKKQLGQYWYDVTGL